MERPTSGKTLMEGFHGVRHCPIPLGELNYRLGEYKKVSTWFNIAFTNASDINASTMGIIRIDGRI